MYNLFLQQELNRSNAKYSIFEIDLTKLQQQKPTVSCPLVFQPLEKSEIEDSTVEILYSAKDRLICYISLKKNTKFIISNHNYKVHLIILFGTVVMNKKTYFPNDHVVVEQDTLLETEFVYMQLITKHRDKQM